MQKGKLVALGILSVLGCAACDGGGTEDKPETLIHDPIKVISPEMTLDTYDCTLDEGVFDGVEPVSGRASSSTSCVLGGNNRHAAGTPVSGGQYVEHCRGVKIISDATFFAENLSHRYDEDYILQSPQFYGGKQFKVVYKGDTTFYNLGERNIRLEQSPSGQYQYYFFNAGALEQGQTAFFCAVYRFMP